MAKKAGRPKCGYESHVKKIPAPILIMVSNAIDTWKADRVKLGEDAATVKLHELLGSKD